MHTLHFALYGCELEENLDPTKPSDAKLLYDLVIMELGEVAHWSDGLSPGGEVGHPARIVGFRQEPDAFRKVLAKCRRWQRESLDEAVAYLAGRLEMQSKVPDRWPEVGQALFYRIMRIRELGATFDHTMWSALRVMKLAYGEYEPESHFFDLIRRQACVPDDREINLMAKEGDLFLIPIDLHY